jgi:hypothetical protein
MTDLGDSDIPLLGVGGGGVTSLVGSCPLQGKTGLDGSFPGRERPNLLQSPFSSNKGRGRK